jgi:glyoxylase-like metal-dependent hydrolase (beta-lactamase superfamily II)
MSLPIAERWYETRTLSDAVTLIRERHVSPDLRCNIWHVRGRDHDLLIDSGLGVVSLRDTVAELSDRPVLALASHTHFDHIGCHHEFEHRLCHPAEAGILTAPTGDNTVWNEYRATMLDEYPLSALPHAGFDLANYRVEPAPPTRLIEEGDELDLGDRLFRVFHMPGHSPGSVCLFEPASRTLFAGDVLYDGELLDSLYHSDADLYSETLARLREIPAETFHCGHYASFGHQRMLELVDAYQAIKR